AAQARAPPDLPRAGAGAGVAVAGVEPSWTQIHVAYRTGSRHPLERGAAGQAILAGRQGLREYVTTAGELQPGARGVAAPIAGVDGLEASVGVVALAELDIAAVGPLVLAAANELARALS